MLGTIWGSVRGGDPCTPSSISGHLAGHDLGTASGNPLRAFQSWIRRYSSPPRLPLRPFEFCPYRISQPIGSSPPRKGSHVGAPSGHQFACHRHRRPRIGPGLLSYLAGNRSPHILACRHLEFPLASLEIATPGPLRETVREVTSDRIVNPAPCFKSASSHPPRSAGPGPGRLGARHKTSISRRCGSSCGAAAYSSGACCLEGSRILAFGYRSRWFQPLIILHLTHPTRNLETNWFSSSAPGLCL